MHACGHDSHMAMALGTVYIINKLKENLNGNIKFVFQPDEEGSGGAMPMIEQGVMENPHVDYSVVLPCVALYSPRHHGGQGRSHHGGHGPALT